MKSKISLIASLLLACSSFAQTNAEPSSVRWICSTEKSRWQEMATTNVATQTNEDSIKLDSQTTFQTIDGFGGCFNELAWEALGSLPAEKREAALKELRRGMKI